MAIQTGLEGKPWYFGAATGAVVAAALVAASWYLLVTPRNKEIAAKVKQLDALQGQINEGRAAKQKLPQFREEVRRLELELEKLLRILPARRNTPELLRRIRQLTEQGSFDLLRFTPGNFVDRDFYSEWPIAIRLNGGYHNLALFFDRVGRFSRIINIENLKIAALPNSPKGHAISASFTAKTFIYREAPPPEPVTSTKGKKGATKAGEGVMRILRQATSPESTANLQAPALLVSRLTRLAPRIGLLAVLLVAAVSLAASAANAQAAGAPAAAPAAPATPAPSGTAAAAAPAEATTSVDDILAGEEDVLAGTTYSYDPGSRRDPFRSLLAAKNKSERKGALPEGIPGLLIEEIDLTGIFRTSRGFVAQVLSSNKEKSYLIREGDQLYDGDVVSITQQEVVFKQIVSDPTVIKPFREVIKKLSP